MTITKEIGDKSIAKFSHVTKGIVYFIVDTENAKYLFPVTMSDLEVEKESDIPGELSWITIKKFLINEELKDSFIRVPKNKS